VGNAIRYIALDKLTRVLGRLSEILDVWVPTASEEKKRLVRFMPYQAGMIPELVEQSTLGPKGALLPQVESLFRFIYEKDPDDASHKRVELEDPVAPKPTLIFGVRPCDARGFLLFDRVFSAGPHIDGLYGARRDLTLLATLVCLEEDAACFCSSVGGGPADRQGSDLWITPIGDGYVVEALNDRALHVMDLLEEPANELQTAAATKVQQEAAERRVGNLICDQSRSNFLQRFDDLNYWQQMAGQCLSCGICTFVCPTCYCFSITDELKGMRGERIRSWDSCMFYTYTLEASGHNPRPTRLERYRNRIGHKFSYIPEKYEGIIGCCGCGRCIRSCPVSIDIRKVVENLEEKAHACA
jgi:ferredoxin